MKTYENPKQSAKEWLTAQRKPLRLEPMQDNSSQSIAISGYVWQWIRSIVQK